MDARQIIADVLKEQFPDVTFIHVTVERDVDEYGDDILWVSAVYDDTDRKLLDPRAASGVVGRIRPRLEQIGEYAFPVPSFVAHSDMRTTKPEAA